MLATIKMIVIGTTHTSFLATILDRACANLKRCPIASMISSPRVCHQLASFTLAASIAMQEGAGHLRPPSANGGLAKSCAYHCGQRGHLHLRTVLKMAN